MPELLIYYDWMEALAGFTLVSLIYEINDLAKQCDTCRHLGKWIISRDQGRVLVLFVGKKNKRRKHLWLLR